MNMHIRGTTNWIRRDFLTFEQRERVCSNEGGEGEIGGDRAGRIQYIIITYMERVFPFPPDPTAIHVYRCVIMRRWVLGRENRAQL